MAKIVTKKRGVYVFIGLSIAVAFFVLSVSALADSLNVNFNTYTTGQPPGGGWVVTSGAPTSAEVVSQNGNNVLLVYNNGGPTGAIENVISPRLADLAGQTGLSAQPGATENEFTYRYNVSFAGSTISNFSFVSNSEGADRTTWLGFTSDGSGNLSVGSYDAYNPGPKDSGTTTWNYHTIGTNLAWGDSYAVTSTLLFGSGPNSDVVTSAVYDLTTGTNIGSVTGTSWADYFLYDSEQAGNGNIMPGADSVMFEMRGSPSGISDGVYVSGLCYSTSSVPEPPTGWLLGVGLLCLLGLGLARKMIVRP